MTEKKPKILFTLKYKDLIIRARELNSDKRIYGDIYFHPVKTGNIIRIKNINLKSEQPLCEVNSTKLGEQNWEEHWLESYIINKSKRGNWEFDTSNKTYKFLSSQLRFHSNEALRGHVITDVLLYDSIKEHLVIWELKSNASETSFNTAIDELDVYCKELTRLFIDDETERYNARLAYGLEGNEIRKVDGYVVLPKNDRNYQTAPFGLYEYSGVDSIINHGKLVKPWSNYRGSMDINFELKGKPE